MLCLAENEPHGICHFCYFADYFTLTQVIEKSKGLKINRYKM